MSVVFIEARPGIRGDAKKKMVEKVTSAIDETYHIGDTLVFLRKYAPENVGYGWAPAVGKPENPGSPEENRHLRQEAKR